ncbi:TPA: DNA internalization-related competence protein ComEC/Rec2 [Staphylococcus aureus]|nr:DNA internalization-related competence protein ComEC/Rec2 [Staphylococcus aureus]HDB6131835.1 DNA internalization-related competence protein ComEC/Rec2 [Staphylococcus aureus]HDC3330768.1 DNA internalization-related competence protein ComEC/Rec2 [Staphylococcus aureus]
MLFVALSMIVGVLWNSSKVLSTFLFILLLYITYRKNKIVYAPISLFLIIFSAWYLHYSQQAIFNYINYIERNSQFNERAQVIQIQRQGSDTYKGRLSLKNEIYPFFLTDKKNFDLKKIESRNCIVKGQFKVNDNKFVTLKLQSIVVQSCLESNRSNLIEKHKQFIMNRIYDSGIKFPDRIMALITGDVKEVNEQFKERVKEIGIYHLLAVSGSHIAAIVFLIYQPLKRLNLPLFVIKGITIIVLALFAQYTNYAPSAVRAIIMTTLVLVITKQIKIKSIQLLAFAFIIMFIAQLASFIVAIPSFHQLQWVGFLSNLIFVPYYSIILFPLSILFFITSHFIVGLTPLNYLVDLSFNFHDWLLDLFTRIKQSHFSVPKFNDWIFIVFIISVYYIFWLLAKRKYILVTFWTIIILTLLITFPTNSHHKITMLNVGQGDSILYEGGKNQNVLIDTGGKVIDDTKQPSYSISKYHILPTLNERGINELEYLILTHPHNDHIGEVEYIISHIKIKHIVIYNKGYSSNTLMLLSKLSHKYNIKLMDVRQVSSFKLGDSSFLFFDSFIPNSRDKNEYSIITMITYQNKKVLLMGDASKNNESLLLKKYNLPEIDILKVGHHGSKTSSSKEFIEMIKPKISLISSGKNNMYHLPNIEVVKRLQRIRSRIYNSQQNGQVTIDLDDNLKVDSSSYGNASGL